MGNNTVKTSPGRKAAQEFTGACEDVRKAWFQSHLLSISKPQVISRVRLALVNQDYRALTALMLEIMGPVAPIDPRDAMGPVSAGHQAMAGIVCSMAMRVAIASRREGTCIDLQDVKQMLLNWIEFGDFGVRPPVTQLTVEQQAQQSQVSLEARRMASVFDGNKYPERMRLAVLAPLAPPLESLIVVSTLSETMLQVMSRTADQVAGLKVEAQELVKAAMTPEVERI